MKKHEKKAGFSLAAAVMPVAALALICVLYKYTSFPIFIYPCITVVVWFAARIMGSINRLSDSSRIASYHIASALALVVLLVLLIFMKDSGADKVKGGVNISENKMLGIIVFSFYIIPNFVGLIIDLSSKKKDKK
ncbi:MAG: hypothetical protein IKO44_01280 [Ruminococcus sp.]|nr:hypothetical protein [Ruminococcus sp.]